MNGVTFVDANCAIGKRRKVYSFSVTEKDDIKKELQRCGITKAVCHHTIAREFDALSGNRILAKEIQGDDFFLPAHVMLPNHAGDFLPPDQLEIEWKENSVRLVKMFPASNEHRFSFQKWNLAEIFSFLCTLRMPLMVSLKNVTVNDLYEVLSAYPKLRLILTDASYLWDRDLMRLMQMFEHLFLETSNYTTLDGIEYITHHFGAERLIFGSGAPYISVGAAVSKILYADISKPEKEKIAHGNLEHLMQEVALS